MQLVQILDSLPALDYSSGGLQTANRGYYVYVTEACNIRCNYCVSGDTLITLRSGQQVPISEIQVGDEVAHFVPARPGVRGKAAPSNLGFSKVEKVTFHESPDHYILRAGDLQLKITGDHPVWLVDTGEYVEVKDLRPGNRVMVISPEKVQKKSDLLKRLAIKARERMNSSSNPSYNTASKRKQVLSTRSVIDSRGFLYKHSDEFKKQQSEAMKEFNPMSVDSIKYPTLRKITDSHYQKQGGVSQGELAVRRALDTSGIKYLTDQQIGPYFPDMYLPDSLVVVEVDRHQRHFTPEGREADKKRDQWFAERGIKTVRIVGNQCFNSAVVMDKVQDAIESSVLSNHVIDSIEHVNEPLTVWNLQLAGKYNNFLANNIVVHNCFVDDKHNHNHLFDPVSYAREAEKEDKVGKVIDWILNDPEGRQSKYIHFFGGEPLIRAKSIDRMCQELTERAKTELKGCQISFGITTNGTLLTEENCLMMKKWKIGVQLSLDGSEEGNDVHRQLMGGDQRAQGMTQNQNEETNGKKYGAFKMVKVDNYLKHFGTNARMTLTIYNLPYLMKSIVDLSAMGFKSFSVIPDSDAGEWMKDNSLEKYRDAVEELWKYSLEHPEITINFIYDINQKLFAGKTPDHLCQAGRNVIGISVDGALWPCHDFLGKFQKDPAKVRELQIGHIDQGWTTNTKKFEDVKCDSEVKSGAGYDCNTCHAKSVCERGCPYVNYTSTGAIKTVSEMYCRLTRINVDVALRMHMISGKLDPTKQIAHPIPPSEKLQRIAFQYFKNEAPFGRAHDGSPLLPGPARAKELGLEGLLEPLPDGKYAPASIAGTPLAVSQAASFDGERGMSSFINSPVPTIKKASGLTARV